MNFNLISYKTHTVTYFILPANFPLHLIIQTHFISHFHNLKFSSLFASEMGKTTKGVCVFNANLQSKYPFIQKTTTESDVKCLKCHSRFSIAGGGNNDIVRHLKTAKHTAAINAGIAFHSLSCENLGISSEFFLLHSFIKSIDHQSFCVNIESQKNCSRRCLGVSRCSIESEFCIIRLCVQNF